MTLLFTRGKGQIFMMARLNTPLEFLIVTTRKMPFFPEDMLVITALVQWRGAFRSSLSWTSSPVFRLGVVLSQP